MLNVRRLPAEGLARLWQKPRIEVLAHVPEKSVLPTTPLAPFAAVDELQISALAELLEAPRCARCGRIFP